MTQENYGLADLHIHSSLSDGASSILEILEYVEQETKLDVIAITDHDEIRGSYQARELAEGGNYRFDVVVGMEVTTLSGHLLALFVERPVPSHQSLVDTIAAVHDQGGLCIAPHPMIWGTPSISQSTLSKIAESPQEKVYLDGLETINSHIITRLFRRKVRRLNETHYHLAEIGGSDAHFLAVIGSGYTLFPGRSAAELRQSIGERMTQTASNGRVGISQIGYSQLVRYQFRCLLHTCSFFKKSVAQAFDGLFS